MGRFQRSSYGIRRLWTRKRIAQALDLRAEFGDFGDGMRVLGGVGCESGDRKGFVGWVDIKGYC